MASRKEQRERAREERNRQEAEEQAKERRQRLTRLGVAAVFAAVVVVAIAIAISQSGDDSGGDTSLEGASQVSQELRGLEQRGLTLGDPNAKVTVAEFGDLQCPVCKDYSEEMVPALIEGPVRRGDAKLEFRNWVIFPPDSLEAAKAALAASRQGRYWSFVTLFYRNQGAENSGYVTDDFLNAVARGAGVEDLDKWDQDRQSSEWDSQLEQISTEAQQLGFSGTPSFLVEGPNGRQPLSTPVSAADIESAIEAVG
jgi:protein-disulfide isomerase